MVFKIFIVFCFIGVFGFTADREFIPAFIAAAIIITPRAINLWRASRLQPSTMICPNCGSGQVRITSRVEGVTGNSSGQFNRSFLLPWHRARIDRQTGSQINRQRVAVCQSCGFDYLYFTADEIRQQRQNGKRRLVIVVSIVFLCFLIGLLTDPSAQEATPDEEIGTSSPIWSIDYAELSDFDYYIDGHSIILKSYNGRLSQVRIAPSYNVDGELMPVVALEGTFTLGSINSVIVPEGVTRIADNTFNSCDVTNLYLPATLTDFSGWNYFHKVQKIYYGGTEDQWNALYTDERSQLDVVRIIYDADLSELLTQ